MIGTITHSNIRVISMKPENDNYETAMMESGYRLYEQLLVEHAQRKALELHRLLNCANKDVRDYQAGRK